MSTATISRWLERNLVYTFRYIKIHRKEIGSTRRTKCLFYQKKKTLFNKYQFYKRVVINIPS